MQDATNQVHDDSNIFEYAECEGEPSKLPNRVKKASKCFKLLEDAQ